MEQNLSSERTKTPNLQQYGGNISAESAKNMEAGALPPQNTASKIFSGLFIILLAFFFCIFSALCLWQINRLAWKENLVARVNARIHLPPEEAKPRAEWTNISAEKDEYRPIRVSGVFLHDKEILVKASVLLSALDESGGAGFWVMTPLQTADNSIIFINRGFVPFDKKEQARRAQNLPQTAVTVTGLLRMSENSGVLFNKNNPQNHIWYHRTLPSLAAAAGLPPQNVAPYFIDAENETSAETAPKDTGGMVKNGSAAKTSANIWPRRGLTQVQFPNNHLVYAITWFCGALGTLFAAFLIFRSRKRGRRAAKQ